MEIIMGTKIRKDNKMLKRILDEIYLIVLLILLLILASGSLHAQVWDAPSGYTDYAGLRLYATGANAGSDSLNQNLIDIDSLLDAHQDTLDAIKADLYGISDYAGGYKDATIAWADLSSAAKSNIVQTSGAQNIAGPKTFTDGMYTDGIYPNTSDTYNIGKKEERYNRIYSNYTVTGAVVINTAMEDDSVTITYDGISVAMNKPLELKNNLIVKDSVTFSAFALSGDVITPDAASDSIITLPKTMSSIYYVVKDWNMSNVKRITMAGAGNEQILVITLWTNTNTVVLKDMPTGGNLNLAGDFTMGALDTIMLKYNAPTDRWYEICRSNN